jgi:hypothetical protein
MSQRVCRILVRPASISLALLVTACSPLVILFSPLPTDFSVLELGTPREDVTRELGFPRERSIDPSCPEILSNREGYSILRRAFAVPFLLFFDVFMFGVPEIRSWPATDARSTAEVGVLVFYDAEERVETACVYQGYSLISSRRNAPRPCEDHELRIAACIQNDSQ